MIDYLRGTVTELNPTYAVVECAGVGYEVNITLMDYSKVEFSAENKFYIEESIREDSHTLYGFLDKRSRELYRLLIGVSGVGPSMARLILSSLTPDQLEGAIAAEDILSLKAVKGVGAKTAQRIIVDLKDKIKADASALFTQQSAAAGEAYEDSLSALIMLGFSTQQSQKVLKKIFAENQALSTEQAIKQALTML